MRTFFNKINFALKFILKHPRWDSNPQPLDSKSIALSNCATRTKCICRESDPGHLLGRQVCYHYTTDAKNCYVCIFLFVILKFS